MIIYKSKKYNNNYEIIKDYNKQGFVTIRNYIPKISLTKIKNDLNKVSKEHFKKKFLTLLPYLDKVNKKKLWKFHNIFNNLQSLKSLNLELSNFNKLLFPKKNTFYITDGIMLCLPKDKRLTYDFHQETHYMKNFKDILNIHYPIFLKSEKKNGSMSVLAKSHKEGQLKYIKKRMNKNSYTDLIPNKIQIMREKYEEVLLELEVGDVAFFHKDLIHKSNYNYTNKPRPVGIGRFTSSIGNFKYLKSEEL